MAVMTRVDRVSEKTLSRLTRWSAAGLAVLVAAFAAVYVIGQRVDAGPTLSERQISAAEEAVRAAPQKVELRLQLAATYADAGRTDDALAQYAEVLTAVPGSKAAQMGKGSLLMKTGDLTAAAAAFRTVTAGSTKAEFSQIDPQLEAAHYFLGSIATTQGDLATAATELRAALAMDSTDADAWYLLGDVETRNGNPKTAVTDLRKALAFVPTGWCEPYAGLEAAYQKLADANAAEYAGAMVDFCQKNPAQATTRLEALTTGPVALDALLGLGLIAETSADRTAAVGWYQKALKADPGNAAATTAISRLTGTGSSTTTQAGA
jgi:tetratricopeptide (TPR) repeat protein